MSPDSEAERLGRAALERATARRHAISPWLRRAAPEIRNRLRTRTSTNRGSTAFLGPARGGEASRTFNPSRWMDFEVACYRRPTFPRMAIPHKRRCSANSTTSSRASKPTGRWSSSTTRKSTSDRSPDFRAWNSPQSVASLLGAFRAPSKSWRLVESDRSTASVASRRARSQCERRRTAGIGR